MKVPETPPRFHDLFAKMSAQPGWAAKVFRVGLGPTVGERYRHWDVLRRLQPPPGLTIEQWWLSLKLARVSAGRPLPFRDAAGLPFTLSVCDPLMRMTSELDRSLGGLLPQSDEVTNPATRDRHVVSALIEEAITSSQLEGATTTRKVAGEMLRSGRAPRTAHERMIVNNFRAMEFVRAHSSEALTEALVLEIHRRVTEDTLEDATESGRYRTAEEDVRVFGDSNEVVHVPPQADQLEDRMRVLCAFANGEAADLYVHPVVRSVLLHFALAYDHPFTDGNGRTARSLFYWSMLHEGYGLAEFLSVSHILRKSPVRYSRAFLYTETDDRDATYFVLFHLDVILRSVEALHQYLKVRVKELQETRRLARNAELFNHRQLALLGHALKDPDARYSFRSHSTSHGVVHQTARQDLLGLEGHGLLSKGKSGRQMVFHPVPDLERRLRTLTGKRTGRNP